MPRFILHILINSQERITKHFFARVVGFIVVPLILYLFFFWIHFTILTHSGTGDTFMTPAFQETLIGNELLLNSNGEDFCVLFFVYLLTVL